MTGLGVGEIVGGPGLGFIVDKFGSKFTCLVNCAFVVMCVTVTLVIINMPVPIPVLCLLTFMWGCHDGGISAHTNEILGF